MNGLRRVINNTLISFLGQAVSSTSALLLTIAYGHFLNSVEFGELYLALAIIALLGTPIEAGYSNQIIRDVAQDPEKARSYFSNIFLIKLGIWPFLFALALCMSWLLGYNSEVRMLVAICGLTLLSIAIAGTFKSLYYAFEKTIIPTVGLILEKVLTVIFCILLLTLGAGVQAMALVMLGASVVNVVWMAIWFFHLKGTKFVIDLALIRQILRANIPFLIQGVLLVSYDRIDTFLLSLMASSTVIGWYSAAIRIFDTLNFLPTIVIFTIMYPVFSKLSTSSEASLKLAIEKSVNFLLFCSIPIATLMIVAAPNIIGFLYYRAEYAHSVLALQMLAPGLIFLYLNFPLSTILLSLKQDKKLPMMAAIALVFTVGLNLILIPRYQQVGTAVVTTLTEVLLFCIGIVFVPRHLLPLGSSRVAVKALLASLVMAAAILPLHTYNIFVILPVAMLVYLGAALLLGVIPREDYQAVYDAMRRKVQPGTSLSSNNLPEIHSPLYDLPTMPIPAYYGGTLLDIKLAVTGKLPVIRLPLAPQRTGLVTNSLPKTPGLLYDLPITAKPAYLADPLLDIELVVTENLPTIHIKSEQEEQRSLKAIRLQPLPIQQHSLKQQGQIVPVSEVHSRKYIRNSEEE